MAYSWSNKTVWITGASSGIGAALAIALAAKGAKLILSARSVDQLEEVKQQCVKPNKVFIAPLDLNQFESLEALTKRLLETHQIDILINNGGISQRSLVHETDISVYEKLMRVNYLGTVALSKALLPHFRSKQNGHYVVISSLMGKFGAPLRSGYAGAKHALHGFFETLRAENYDSGVKVTMVCPGYIKTDVSKNALTATGKKQNTMDEKSAQGISAEKCASSIIKAIEKNKSEVYIGRTEILGIYLHRFFPNLLRRIVRKTATT